MSQKEAAKTEALTAEIDMIRRKDSSPSERAKGPVQRKKEQEAKAEFEIEGVKKKRKRKEKVFLLPPSSLCNSTRYFSFCSDWLAGGSSCALWCVFVSSLGSGWPVLCFECERWKFLG